MPESSLQRLSVYAQRKRNVLEIDAKDESEGTGLDTKIESVLESFEHENTLLVFDSAHETSFSEPLFLDKQSWRDLMSYHEYSLDDHLPDSSLLMIASIQLIFEAIADEWSEYVLGMHNHVASLEEEIYSDPANDTRATAVWGTSKQLLQAERLLKFQILLLEDLQAGLPDSLLDFPVGRGWLRQNIQDFIRLGSEVEETLKKPVAHMVDLMYKSISIRDARQSLELSTSLWRLSWITFIFLPLTLLCGFFGMNVSVFHDEPSVGWYFIVAVPLMCLVMFAWLSARKWMQAPNKTF